MILHDMLDECRDTYNVPQILKLARQIQDSELEGSREAARRLHQILTWEVERRKRGELFKL